MNKRTTSDAFAYNSTVESNGPKQSLHDSMQTLPKFYSAKMFILIEKLCCITTGLASGMVTGLEEIFGEFPEAELNTSLRNSKSFKTWHRSIEDLIDETGDLLKSKLLELANIMYEVTGEDMKVRDFMSKQLDKCYHEAAGRMPKKTAEALSDLSQIIMSSNILDSNDIEVSIVPQRTTRNQALDDTAIQRSPSPNSSGLLKKHTGNKKTQDMIEEALNKQTNEGPKKSDNTKKAGRGPEDEQPVRQGKTATNAADLEDDQLIRNVRITKGIIGSHSSFLTLNKDFLYHIVLSSKRDFVVVAGKDLPLTKWTFDTFEKVAETEESMIVMTKNSKVFH